MDRVSWASERSVLRVFDGLLEEANARALAFARRVGDIPGIEDVIPGARSVLVVLDRGSDGPRQLFEPFDDHGPPGTRGKIHEFSVTYDGEDLPELARLCGIDVDEVVRLHSGAEYRTAFLGFSPGFAYLIGLPEVLRVPRLDTPRTRVPAGSVAVAAEFTAVYPRATPGGWRLIGRTDAAMFDARARPPSLVQPGDRVRFVPA